MTTADRPRSIGYKSSAVARTMFDDSARSLNDEQSPRRSRSVWFPILLGSALAVIGVVAPSIEPPKLAALIGVSALLGFPAIAIWVIWNSTTKTLIEAPLEPVASNPEPIVSTNEPKRLTWNAVKSLPVLGAIVWLCYHPVWILYLGLIAVSMISIALIVAVVMGMLSGVQESNSPSNEPKTKDRESSGALFGFLVGYWVGASRDKSKHECRERP